MEDYAIIREDPVDPQDAQFLAQQILAFNQAHTGRKDDRQVLFLARDAAGQIAGGLIGWTFLDWMAVDYLWVREDLRGQGIGSRLLASAEELARERGCHSMQLDTFSFQAPDFYRRHGFEVFGVLDGYAGKHQRIYFRKRL